MIKAFDFNYKPQEPTNRPADQYIILIKGTLITIRFIGTLHCLLCVDVSVFRRFTYHFAYRSELTTGLHFEYFECNFSSYYLWH